MTLSAAHGVGCVKEVSSPIGLAHSEDCATHKDDAARIQAAIDKVSGWPLKLTPGGRSRFRGRVQLGAGTFFVSATLRLRHSGVILQGVGGHCRPNKVTEVSNPSMCTNIVAEGLLDSVVSVGLDAASAREISSSRSAIAQSYVAAGATQVRVRARVRVRVRVSMSRT